jgi:hypothetical protein
MNTLHQAGDFVGIPRGARQVARFDSSRVTTLEAVSFLIDADHPAGRPRSLGSAIRRLSGLPPLDLQVSLLSPTRPVGTTERNVTLSGRLSGPYDDWLVLVRWR